MSQLIIVRGLPGSGKTTFAKALAQKHFQKAALFAADDFFMEGDTYAFDGARLGEAHGWCQRKTLEALQNSTNVIVHNTFVTSKEFDPYLAMVTQAKVDIRVYNVFDGGLCDAKLSVRGAHGVPIGVIGRMRANFTEAPVTEMHVSISDNYAHWQYPTVKAGEFKYEPDWLELETT